MKRITLLCCLLTGSLLLGHAQDLAFGPRLGLNFSDVTINGQKDEGRTRLHLGAFASVAVANQVSAQAEILLSHQGNRQIGRLDGVNSMNYLQIPLLGKYEPIEGLSIYAGPQVGIALVAKFKSDNTGEVYKVEDVLSPLDLSLLFGGEYEVYPGLMAGARYFFSLSDTHQDEDKVGRNRVFQLSLAYDIAALLGFSE